MVVVCTRHCKDGYTNDCTHDFNSGLVSKSLVLLAFWHLFYADPINKGYPSCQENPTPHSPAFPVPRSRIFSPPAQRVEIHQLRVHPFESCASHGNEMVHDMVCVAIWLATHVLTYSVAIKVNKPVNHVRPRWQGTASPSNAVPMFLCIV